MGQELRRAAEACKVKHGDEVGDGARVQPRATFSIREGRLTISNVEITVEEITEDGQFQSCVQTAALSLVIEAPGHREIERDVMAVPIKL